MADLPHPPPSTPADTPPADPPADPPLKPRDRAMVFVDGANFYRRLKDAGVRDPNHLDLRLVARKLATPARDVAGIRYYTGKVSFGTNGDSRVVASQQRLLSSLGEQGVAVILGRLEQRYEGNHLAEEMLNFLASPPPEIKRLQPELYRALFKMANENRRTTYWIQKAVDTALAVEIAQMAIDNQYDVAYVLSQDGDMTPGILLARRAGLKKKVFGAGPAGRNHHIKQACDHYIILDAAWLTDCYLATET